MLWFCWGIAKDWALHGLTLEEPLGFIFFSFMAYYIWLSGKFQYNKLVLRRNFEKVVMEDEFLVHIGLTGQVDARIRYADIKPIEQVRLGFRDGTKRWLISDGNQKFEVGVDLNNFDQFWVDLQSCCSIKITWL